MSRLIESINCSDGQLRNLNYHLSRMKRSITDIYNVPDFSPDFNHILSEAKKLDKDITYKLRVVYDDKTMQHTFTPYEMKIVDSIKLIIDNDIAYTHKLTDRTRLDQHFQKLDGSDDFIIVKNGRLTDSYYCNIALQKDGEWHTPSQPLLKGTMRQMLLDNNMIKPANIKVSDINAYDKICLFNAMIEFESVVVPTSHIITPNS